MSMAAKRLQKEAIALAREPPQHVRAKPLETDILIFHYVIEGPKGTPFEGGFYHGVLKFPAEYPLKPPSVMMYTPSGRFAVATRLCLSMSDYHPETWNPVWSVSTILVGLMSFMLEQTDTVGSIKTGDDTKKKFAVESLEYNTTNKDFCKLFPELVELAEQRRREAAQLRLAQEANVGQRGSVMATTPSGAQQAPKGSWTHSMSLLVVAIAVLLVWIRNRGASGS